MKKVLTAIIVVSFIVSTYWLVGCNKKSPDLTREEVYKILNEIIADDSLHLSNVCWKATNLAVAGEYGFSNSDKVFIKRQSELLKDFTFEPKRLKFYSKRKKGFDFSYIDSACTNGILTHLSFPLISADRQRVVIENTEDCNCDLGGRGGKYLYIKQQGHWKMKKSFDTWISKIIKTELDSGSNSLCKNSFQAVGLYRRLCYLQAMGINNL